MGDVNISAILDSFSVSYDKRVRPNYGGKFYFLISSIYVTNIYIYIYVCIYNCIYI